jgi:hypothetical protein
MSKSSRKSLPTLLLALSLLVMQAAMMAQPSATQAAASKVVIGPAIYLSASSSVYPAGFSVTVHGTGFLANSTVVVTWNAPWSLDGSSLSPRSLPPNAPRYGDNIDGDYAPPNVASYNTYPNAIQVQATTDADGNLISPINPGNAPVINVPAYAADGTYLVTAEDAAVTTPSGGTGPDVASATYTITHGPNTSQTYTPGINNEPLVATPVYNANGSVSIEGLVNVASAQKTFASGDLVQFYLENFAWTPDNPAYVGGTGVNDIMPGASDKVLLEVLSCGSAPVNPGGGVAEGVTYCPADINGAVQAVVQIQHSYLDTAIDLQAGNAINSLQYYDQVYSIVAINDGAQGATACPNNPSSNNINGCITTPIVKVNAGIHLDHGQTQIALSTNQQTLSGSVVVNGTGFGAFDQVNLYYVSVGAGVTYASNLCTGVGYTGAGSPDSCGGVNPFYYSPILLGTAQTDAAGHFLITVGVNSFPGLTGPSSGSSIAGNSTGGSIYPGYVLAEDFSTHYAGSAGPGLRLNEAATAALAVTNTASTNGLLSVQGQTSAAASGVVSGNIITAAISSTITITGSGYEAGEAVSFKLQNAITATAPATVLQFPGTLYPAGSNPAYTTTCDAYPLGVVTANAQGVATATFLVPENCNTVNVTSSGTVNAGANVVISGIGESTGVTDLGGLTILPTSAQVVPTNPAYAGSQAGTGIPVNLVGSGFSSNEPVTFQFYEIDPFLGTLTSTPVLSISAVSDVSGNVSIAAVLPNGLTGGLYTLKAAGLASGFTSATNVGVPFVFVEGNLNCPTSVLPGQVINLNGANFAAGTNVLVTLTSNASAVPSLTGSLPTSVFALTSGVTAGGTFSISPTIPLGLASGSYTVTVSGLIYNPTSGTYQEQLRQCTVTVGTTAPAIVAAPNSGPIGTVVTVVGTGFGVNEPIQLSLQYIDPTGAISGTDVTGSAQVVSTTSTTGAFTSTYVVGSNVNALIAGQYNLVAKGLQTGAIARTPFVVTGSPSTANPTTIFFAEGYTGSVAGGANADFTESLSILNANNYTTTYTVTYYIESQFAGAPSTLKSFGGTLGPNSVVERSVNTDVGAGLKVAASVTSPAPISADRIISRSLNGKALDSDSSLGQLINLSAAAPTGGFNYYFAAGDYALTNEEYLTMLNPTSSVANVTVTVLPQSPASATSVPTITPATVTIQPMSRATLPIRQLVAASNSGVSQYGLSINSNVALANERVEYFGDGIGSGKYGASTKAAGTTSYRQLIFAAASGVFPSAGGNAASGTGNDISQIAIVNPGTAAAGSATVTVSAFTNSGAPINSQQVQVDGGTRETINLNDIVGTQSDVFSVIVTSDKSVYAEKLTSYGGDPANGGTFAVAGSSGSPAGLTQVQFPYLDLTSVTGTAISQTVYLYNPGATAISVRGTFVSSTGAAPVVKTYAVAANSITAVSVNADAAALPKGAVGAVFQIINNGGTNGGTGNGDSFVASVVSNAPDWSNVSGDQGQNPIGAAQGS